MGVHVQALLKKEKDFQDKLNVSNALADSGKEVEISPIIPEAEKELRNKILPGVIGNKNPDLRVNGEYYEVRRPKNSNARAISQNIRKASHQAANVIIILNEKVDKQELERITKGRFKTETNLKKIMFYYRGELTEFIK